MNYKQQIIEAGIQMASQDLTIETWGNLSLRDPTNGHIYLTPSGMPYDTLKEEDICVLDKEGNLIEGT